MTLVAIERCRIKPEVRTKGERRACLYCPVRLTAVSRSIRITMQPASDSELKAETYSTLRPTVPALEAMLKTGGIAVLDHGFIRVVDYMGDDDAIVQAARVSYGKGTKHTSEDRGLIRYLMRNWHSTPFEMCELKLHVKLPIFVARQWIRHRTANVNEYSARYSVLDREFYLPAPEQLAAQSSSNRQGKGDVLDAQQAEQVLRLLRDDADRSYDVYESLLNEPGSGSYDPSRDGLSRELARIGLGLSTYTQWYWKTDLHNLFNFLRLRADAHAQYEIRAYADILLDVTSKWVPAAYEAFLDYRLNAVSLSAAEVALVQQALVGAKLTREGSGLTQREWDEFAKRFKLPTPIA